MASSAASTPPYPYLWRDGAVAPLGALLAHLDRLRAEGREIVTTNGCFDILHTGHLALLSEARARGDLLVVAINSDRSVCALKGPGHPFVLERDRAEMLAALRCVDFVVVFDDLLPTSILTLLRPAVHCKGPDYTIDMLPEAAVVRRLGGRVEIVQGRGGSSTTLVIDRILSAVQVPHDVLRPHRFRESLEDLALTYLLSSVESLRKTAYHLGRHLVSAAVATAASLTSGNKVLLCGNGGAAAIAEHIATEFVLKFRDPRSPLPALALSANTSLLTAAGNDLGFNMLFERQILAYGRPGDTLVALSTSGTSANVVAAARTARSQGIRVIAMTRADAVPLADDADIVLGVPTRETPNLQEAFLTLLHGLCELVEHVMADSARPA